MAGAFSCSGGQPLQDSTGQQALFDEPREVVKLLDNAPPRAQRRRSAPGARRPRSPQCAISVDPEKVTVKSVREWGNYAIAFVGWRHFADPGLIERHFRWTAADRQTGDELSPLLEN